MNVIREQEEISQFDLHDGCGVMTMTNRTGCSATLVNISRDVLWWSRQECDRPNKFILTQTNEFLTVRSASSQR